MSQAIAAHERAIALRAATRLPQAERACRRAVALYAKAEGRDHPDVANGLVELGQILEARDRLRDARLCHARALAILGPAGRGAGGDPDLERLRVRARVFMAGADRGLGAYAAAERGFTKALADVTRIFGRGDLDVAGIYNNLGVLRKYQGRYAEAAAFYKRARPLLEKAGDHEALATLYHNLGGIDHARGRYAAGEPHARRSVKLREAQLGRDHVTVAADVAALAALVEGRGRLAEAASLYERALRLFRRKLGPGSAEVALNLSSLASLRQRQRRFAEAERLFETSVRLQERVFGRGHPEVAMTLNNFAFLARERGEPRRAISLYQRALRAFSRVLGDAHPHTRLCRSNLLAVTKESRDAAGARRGLKKPRRSRR